MDVVRLGIEDISGSERYIKSENKLIMNISICPFFIYYTPCRPSHIGRRLPHFGDMLISLISPPHEDSLKKSPAFLLGCNKEVLRVFPMTYRICVVL